MNEALRELAEKAARTVGVPEFLIALDAEDERLLAAFAALVEEQTIRRCVDAESPDAYTSASLPRLYAVPTPTTETEQ